MGLPKDSRILFSKKIVVAPDELVGIDASVASLNVSRDAALALDNAHRSLFGPVNDVITGYHAEDSYYSTIVRTSIVEQDLVGAANFAATNYFYPHNPSLPPPSLAPSVWVKTKPYARNLAVGKLFSEAYPGASQTNVPAYLATTANALNVFLGSYTDIARATGLKCDTLPANPPISDSALQSDATVAKASIDGAATYLSAIKSVLLSIPEYDTTRKAANAALSVELTNAISQISTWDALPNYSSHFFSNCSSFTGYNPSLLTQSKYRMAEFLPIINLLQTLATDLGNRQTYVEGVLGSLTQNLSTAEVTGTGLYFERWSLLALRLNMLGGSLIGYYSIQRAIDFQAESKANILANQAFYSTKLTATKLAAPSNGTKYLHVIDASGFTAGDQIYVVSDTQDEISLGVESINGNTLFLGMPVPPKYRDSEYGRVYREV